MELRKDYFLNQWVIINQKRSERPHNIETTSKNISKKNCFFCRNNESLTPEELGRVGNPWRIRWFTNKFPIVDDSKVKFKVENNLEKEPAFGYHEVIVETHDHTQHIADLTKSHMLDVLKVYQNRYNELSKRKKISFVSLFKNKGATAGASIDHEHSQIIAISKIPDIIKTKVQKNSKKCLYCDIIKKERKSKRFCFENKEFIAFTPYASMFNYEIWLLPKKHIQFENMNEEELKNMNELFQKILKKLKKLGCDFNYYFNCYKNLHFHVVFTPRMAHWAGFEHATEIIVNSVSPEFAAEFYRD